MDFNELIYELKPFVFLGAGIFAVIRPNPPSWLIMIAIVSIAWGAWILKARFKARARGTKVEALFYESQPYIYTGLGIWALATQSTSKGALASAMVLFAVAALIFKWRKDSRR